MFAPAVLAGVAANTRVLLIAEFSNAVFAMLLVFLFFPGSSWSVGACCAGTRTGTDGTNAAAARRRVGVAEWRRGLWATMRSPTMLLTFIAGTVIGGTSSWGMLMPYQLGVDAQAVFPVANGAARLVGNVLGGVLVDRFFRMLASSVVGFVALDVVV